MKITEIKQQVKRAGRYSIFVDGKYAFSLSTDGLLEHKLAAGQELTDRRLKQLKRLSDEDKLYNRTLSYVALRPRSYWEVEFYLKRKEAKDATSARILNKLTDLGMLDDKKFAEAFVNDRRLLRPTSRRKLVQELKKKRIAEDIIRVVIGNEPEDEYAALKTLIERKRRQPKYQDDLKLMQYLARQGFGYGDIKTAFQNLAGTND